MFEIEEGILLMNNGDKLTNISLFHVAKSRNGPARLVRQSLSKNSIPLGSDTRTQSEKMIMWK